MTHKARKQAAPFSLRMADDVKKWLALRAKTNNRSINAEIVTIFQELRAKEGEKADLKPVS